MLYKNIMKNKLENYEAVYNALKSMMYSFGKYGKKKHGEYLHIFSKDNKKLLKMDTYNGQIVFGRVAEPIVKTYDKYNKRFIYGDNEFTGVRCLGKFCVGKKQWDTTEGDLVNAVNAYKFALQNN